MKKIVQLRVLALVALSALLGSDAQAMKKFFGKSSSSKEAPEDRLTRKIEEFSRAQAAARSGEGSARTRDARAAELKSALKKAGELSEDQKKALAALHQEHLPQGKERITSAHQPYSVRKEIEKAIPGLRDERLGTSPSEVGAARAAASTSGRSDAAKEFQREEELRASGGKQQPKLTPENEALLAKQITAAVQAEQTRFERIRSGKQPTLPTVNQNPDVYDQPVYQKKSSQKTSTESPTTPAIKSTPQEEISKQLTPVEVKGEFKKGSVPENIQREIDIKALKDKQAALPEDRVIERAKIDKEIASKKFERYGDAGTSAAQAGDILKYAKSLGKEQKQLKREVEAEEAIRKETTSKLLDKEPTSKPAPTIRETLEKPVMETPIAHSKKPLSEEQLASQEAELVKRPTTKKSITFNKNLEETSDNQAQKVYDPTAVPAKGILKKPAEPAETSSNQKIPPPPPLAGESTKPLPGAAEIPKPESIPSTLAQQSQSGTTLKKVDLEAVAQEKKVSQDPQEALRKGLAEGLEKRREVIKPSKADKAKEKAAEEAFWSSPATQ